MQALFRCDTILTNLLKERAHPCISLLHIRVLLDIGKRALALQALGGLLSAIQAKQTLSMDLPFLPPLPWYEDMNAKSSPMKWLFSSLLEAFELKKTFSSYFSGKRDLKNLRYLAGFGFASAEINRRIALLEAL